MCSQIHSVRTLKSGEHEEFRVKASDLKKILVVREKSLFGPYFIPRPFDWLYTFIFFFFFFFLAGFFPGSARWQPEEPSTHEQARREHLSDILVNNGLLSFVPLALVI